MSTSVKSKSINMSSSNQTHDHTIIKKWVESRKGIPAKIKGTEKNGDEGVLRIHFPEYSKSSTFEEISWEDFYIRIKKRMVKKAPFISSFQEVKIPKITF
jgi:hypothetical protein